MKPVLKPNQIVEHLFSDLGAYKENIETLLKRYLKADTNEHIYWDAWFRGAEGKEMDDATEGKVYDPSKSLPLVAKITHTDPHTIISEREFIHKLEVIFSAKSLKVQLKEVTSFDKDTLISIFEDGSLSEKVTTKVSSLVPLVFKIGNRLFLEGDTKGNHDYIGEGEFEQTATEYFDMSFEMEDGGSVGYSFYSSTNTYFPLASISETMEVLNFINDRKNQ